MDVRRIDTAVDALVVTACLSLPRLLGWSRRTGRVLASAAAVAGATCLLRLIQPGGRALVPPGVSRALDGVTGVALVAAQFQLTDEDSPARGAVAGLGAVLIVAALLLGRGASD